jgi:4-alpha-glucanotransferase
MSLRQEMHTLARRLGVARGYTGYDGRERSVADATLEALLAAMGLDASTEARASEALHELARAELAPGLARVRVARTGAPDLGRVRLRLPEGARGNVRYALELVLEEGQRHTLAGELHAEHESVDLRLPGGAELSFGYHTLHCTLEHAGASSQFTQDLIVAPADCVRVSQLIGERRAVGMWAHLYSLHSARSAGIGDLSDCGRLLRWAADQGLELLGINPLHAVDDASGDSSPYYPLSRLYREPVYIDVDVMLARTGAGAAPNAVERAALNTGPDVDYPAVRSHKRIAFELAHRTFADKHRGRRTELGRAYADYRAFQGEPLRHFATFCALREHLRARDPAWADFRAWPSPFQDPRSHEVERFAFEHADEVDFHAYLQFELEQQLQACARAARDCGMSVGLYGDLAVGDAAFSADVWARPELYARRVSIGAPPDAYSERGQSWGIVPFNPLALRADRYREASALFRQAVRHVGALRIDHVMGLARQFWVPDGATAEAGAYVAFPFDDLCGILALESRRARTLVIGEDLGVVPDGFRERMAQNAMLRSQVLYFERDHAGTPRSPRSYARAALATIGTHDLPPIAGFFEGRDLVLRRAGGNIESDDALARARSERTDATVKLIARLRSEGLLPEDGVAPPLEELVRALCLLLASAESRLVGLALDDLTLERDALNLPATVLAERPNWSRRSRLSLEQLVKDARIAEMLRAVIGRARQR